MDGLVVTIISFLLQALALYLAVKAVAEDQTRNSYGRALLVASILGVLGWLLLESFAVLACGGWFLYLILWFAVIMGVYKISLLRSLGVAIMLVLIRLGLALVLSLFGFVFPSLKMIEL